MVVICVRSLGPCYGLGEELFGHLLGEVVLAGVAVDEGWAQFLGGLDLLLERSQVASHDLLLVGLTCRDKEIFCTRSMYFVYILWYSMTMSPF